MEKILKTGSSRTDYALVTAPVYATTPASAPACTAAKKTFASIVKTTQPTNVKPPDKVTVVASKADMMSKANEA